MKLFIAIAIVMIALAALLIGMRWIQDQKVKSIPKSEIRYVALGDSYTVGEGVAEEERYPNLLTKHLKNDGFNITLVANPALSGRTSQDVLDRQLEIAKSSNPTFTTILIGANDIAQRVTIQKFRTNFSQILDTLQQTLSNSAKGEISPFQGGKNNILVLTIPDFSVTPVGTQFEGGGILLSTVIVQFNNIIKDEAQKHGIKVVDITPLTRLMANDQSLIVTDGLHPSAKEYAEWEKLLYPVAYQLLISNN